MKCFFQGNEELVDNYFHCLKVWSPWLGIGCFGPPMVRQPRWFVFESDSLLWKSLEKHVFDINLLLFSQSDSLVWIINMVNSITEICIFHSQVAMLFQNVYNTRSNAASMYIMHFYCVVSLKVQNVAAVLIFHRPPSYFLDSRDEAKVSSVYTMLN